MLAGPTATGKSALAHHLAKQKGYAVLSADSMLVYRGMDIGTAKPPVPQRNEVTYLGIDLVDPFKMFNAWQYRQRAIEQLARLAPGQNVIVAGGSGLYFKVLTEGLNESPGAPGCREHWERILETQGVEGLQAALRTRAPEALERLADPLNPRRLIRALEGVENKMTGTAQSGKDWSPQPVWAGLQMDPGLLNTRIQQRVEVMYGEGFLEEVTVLLSKGTLSTTARQAIGYAEAIAVLKGECTTKEAMERTVVRTRQLAKRQRTWFRNKARIAWIEVTERDSVESLAVQIQNVWRKNGPSKISS